MNGNYLIPANTKKSMLIFGLFTKNDLILFIVGVGLTLMLLVLLPIEKLVFAVIALIPAMICAFLVMPVPNYYNMRTLLSSAIGFFMNQRKFKWKGWCFTDGEDKK